MSLVDPPRASRRSGLVLSLVRELAEYEKLLHEVEATEADIGAALFGDNPRLFCEIAEWNGEPAGFAVWFINFSTFSGRSGIYLEDLFVRPAQRGNGIGKALLAHLARRMRGERLVATAMVGAGLEHAVDRILQIARRGPDGRVDGVPGRRSGAGGACAGSALMEIVLIVAVADNGVIGAGGAIPWRLKSRSAALQGDDDGQAGGDGPQDLRLAAPAAARAHQYRRHPRCEFSRAGRGGDDARSPTPARSRPGDALRRFATEIAVIGGAEIYAQWMEYRRPSGNHRSSRPARGRYLFCRNRRGGLGRGRARAESGRSGRQRRLFLCDISPAKAALTAFGNVYIDNYRPQA